MENENVIGIILSSFFGLFSILFFLIKGRLKRGDILTQLFYIVLFGNLIWYSALCLEYINAYKPLSFDSDDIFLPDVIFSTFLFKFRFLFLFFFFRLAFRVAGHSLPHSIVRILKISGILIVLLWFVSWLEIPLRSSRGVIDRLMVYTDILIFASVLITSIYIFLRAPFVINGKNKEIIRKLSYVFLIPALMGLFKWIVSDSLEIISGSFERMMIYALIILFNSLIIWWAIKFGNSLAVPVGFIKQYDDGMQRLLPGKYGLTDREMEVVKLISEGKSNQEIADTLFVSIDTIKDHNYNIFIKTGVKSRTQLTNLFLSGEDLKKEG